MTSLLDDYMSKLKLATLMPFETYEGDVYHYTSLGNASSILLRSDKMRLWASRYDCLNDASEGTLPKNRFLRACELLKESGTIEEEFYELIKDMCPNRTGLIVPTIDGKVRSLRDEFKTYVISFSEDPDALAMWNYYSKGNRYEGINIGVSSQAILDSINSSLNASGTMEVQMVKVVYDEDEQIEIMKRAIVDLNRNYEPGCEISVRSCIGPLLSKLKPVFKLSYFSHEKEVRLIVNVFKKFEGRLPISYRSNAGFVIPYIELDFAKEAVSRVMLGPSLGDDESKRRQRDVVQEMMESYGYDALIKYSDIPVRY